MPKKWQSFLRDDNKTEIFHFLADTVGRMLHAAMNIVVVTKEELVLSTRVINLYHMAPCSHEEADMCIFVHGNGRQPDPHD